MPSGETAEALSRALSICSLKSEYGRQGDLTMLQFNDFLMLLKDYRKSIVFESETVKFYIVTITDGVLSIDLTVITRPSPGVEIETPITLSVDSDGDVSAEIQTGEYSSRTISLTEYVTLVMYNLVNAMLDVIEEAKKEVLSDE